jgi:alkanesulfonate monooxygenase SsuD/methylene tetrahydromethanopterin reductase-like flavin-dependent oxidoreductase (luciferase family)
MVLGATERLSVSIGVYLLALRHPLVVARQLADLAALGPGRIVLGVGVGGEDPREVSNCGVDHHTRGRRLDECIEIVRSLLAGETVDHDSEFFHLEGASILPVPREPVPILVGGRSDAAVRRAGRLGDGYHGIWMSPTRYRTVLAEAADHAAAAGRAEVPRLNALNMWCGIDADPSKARGFVADAMQLFYQMPYERFEKWSPAGPPEVIAEYVAEYVAAGCDLFDLIVQAEDPDAAVEAAAEVRRLVLG